MQLIETMDEWEKMLFVGLQLLVPEVELWEIMSTEQCVVCSDGSADREARKGSFGWVISTRSGRRLVKCNGPVYSYKPNSYRAEGYGILSAMRFWMRLQQLRGKPNQHLPRHKAYCDNKSMVDVVKKHRKYSLIYPNATLASEWDVIAEIRTTLLAMETSNRPTLTHVYGHQDNDTSYDALPLEAQLNVDADALAAQFITDHPNWVYQQVPIMPSSGAQLNLPQGTITYNLRLELQHASVAPPLKAKLQTKCSWDDETFDDVDWTAHGRALKKHEQHRVTLVKYLYDILPIGHQVHRYDPKYSDKCPSCDNPPVETKEHFGRCPAPSRVEWRQQFLSNLRAHLESLNTADPLQTLMLEGMKRELFGTRHDIILIPTEVREVAKAQNAIGWPQMLKGRFSNKWKEVQDAHLGPAATPRANGQTWMTSVVDFIFAEFWKLWTLRNGDRHGRDAKTKAQLEQAQALRELKQFYDAHSDTDDPRLKWLFDVPYDIRAQTWRTSNIRQWLNQWDPVLRESYNTSLETG